MRDPLVDRCRRGEHGRGAGRQRTESDRSGRVGSDRRGAAGRRLARNRRPGSRGNQPAARSRWAERPLGRGVDLELPDRFAGSEHHVNPVRAALIGCGKVGHIHAVALKALPEADFTAVCDTSADRAAAFGANYGARPFSDVAAMLTEARPEAVLIATPHPLHAAPTVLAAQAGAHVLVEKPMAATLADCDAMLAAARKAGVLLSVIS